MGGKNADGMGASNCQVEVVRDTVELVICALHCIVLMVIELGGVTRSLSRGMASSLVTGQFACCHCHEFGIHKPFASLAWQLAVDLNIVVLMNTACLLCCRGRNAVRVNT